MDLYSFLSGVSATIHHKYMLFKASVLKMLLSSDLFAVHPLRRERKKAY